MNSARETRSFLKIFAGGVANQILLSGASFAAGLLLIRRVSEMQYGYYVLLSSTIPLLAQVQTAFLSAIVTQRLTSSPPEERQSYIGDLYRDQRRLLFILAFACVGAGGLAAATGVIDPLFAALLGCGSIAAVCYLYREFFRMVLFSYRRPYDILRGDVVYAGVFLAGMWIATRTPIAAIVAALTIGLAALLGGGLLNRALWRHEAWTTGAATGVLVATARLGKWAAAGAAVHWAFTQGYAYVVASTLDVAAVAAISATRLLLMPLGLFSMGVGTVMLTTASIWMQQHGLRGVLKRLMLFALGMACLAMVYIAVIWYLRDWIFLNVLRRDYPERDLLLKIWSLAFLSMVIRDQLIYFLMVQGRFKLLAGLTFACAILGLLVSYFAVRVYGAAGGPLGLMAGELAHVLGIGVLTVRDARRAQRPLRGTPVVGQA